MPAGDDEVAMGVAVEVSGSDRKGSEHGELDLG
jgi:hypothetical protein